MESYLIKYHMRNFIIYILLFAGSLICLLPLLWMVFSSFKSLEELFTKPMTFFPKDVVFNNYIEVWNRVNFSVYFRNSIILVAVKTIIMLYSSTFAGYVFAKINFKWRNTLFVFILATMMLPWPVIIIPRYQLMNWFHWIDSYKALIIPFIFNSFGIFMMRQYIIGLPDSIMESARMDGANEFKILHRLVFPLLGPPLSALAIFFILWIWDDFLWPFLMLNTKSKFTIPIGIAIFKGMFYTEFHKELAAISISVMPVVIAYVFLQRRFVEGLTFTGLKG